MSKQKYSKFIISSLTTFSSLDLYCQSHWIFRKFLRNHIWRRSASFKKKKSHRYFSASITKFSEQLSLTPPSSHIVEEWIRTDVNGIPTWVFSCEFCKIFKNIYFIKQLPTAASERLWCNKAQPYPCSIKMW